jgi:hypothetical protein
LLVSLDGPFFIAFSVFSIGYFLRL